MGEPENSRREDTPETGVGEVTKRHWWLIAFYYLVIFTTIVLSHFGLMDNIQGSTIALLLLLSLPFLLPYLNLKSIILKSIEGFGVKAVFERIEDIKTEMRDTKQTVQNEVRNISDRLDHLQRVSQGFLQPASLPEAFKFIHNIKEFLISKPLTKDDIDKGLSSIDPNARVPAYIELQIRPQESRLEWLLDCLYLEQFLSRRLAETRPMWQLLETMHRLVEACSNLASDRRSDAKRVLEQALQFLETHPKLDPDGECKISLRNLIGKF